MTEKIYEFYVLDPSAEATERRSTNYWVASPKTVGIKYLEER